MTEETSSALRVGIYTRISQDRHESDSIRRQDAEANEYAEQQGWVVVDTFADQGLSASKKHVKRPQYERLLAAARHGEIDAILTWKLDRLTRQPRQIEDLIDLTNGTGVRLISLKDPLPLDTGTGQGAMVLRLFAMLAAGESENISIRTRSKALHRAKSGLPPGGGVRPFGHSADWSELVPDEAEAIREGVAEILGGGRAYAVATRWNAEQRYTVLGKRWRSTNLRQMLIQPRLAGVREVDGQRYGGGFPAIITEDEHDWLVHVLTKRTQSTRHGTHARYMLTGLLRCGRCGGRMSSGGKDSGGGMIYRCPQTAIGGGCGLVSINGAKAEQQVQEAYVAAVARQMRDEAKVSEGAGRDSQSRFQELRETVGDIDRRLGELAEDYYGERIINRRTFVERAEGLNLQRQTVLQELERVEAAASTGGLPEGFGANFWANDADARRQTLHMMIDRVTVLPATSRGRYDPDRLEIRWVWETDRWLPNIMAKMEAEGVRFATLDDYRDDGRERGRRSPR